MILTAFHGFCMRCGQRPRRLRRTIAFIPFIAAAERTALKKLRGAPFALLGMAVVVGLTLLRGLVRAGKRQLRVALAALALYIFLSGAVAITAMVLLGILGSSILLIAGVYLPPFRLSAASCTWSFPCCRGSSRWASACSRAWRCPFTPSAPRCTNTAARWSGSF